MNEKKASRSLKKSGSFIFLVIVTKKILKNKSENWCRLFSMPNNIGRSTFNHFKFATPNFSLLY